MVELKVNLDFQLIAKSQIRIKIIKVIKLCFLSQKFENLKRQKHFLIKILLRLKIHQSPRLVLKNHRVYNHFSNFQAVGSRGNIEMPY